MSIVKNCTALHARKASVDKSKISGKTIIQILWQTFINYQRTRLKVEINGNVIEGLLDMDIDVKIISASRLTYSVDKYSASRA